MRVTVAAALLLTVAGALLTWWTVSRADRQMREGLLEQARLVAQTVNLQRVKALDGAETDLKKPEYQRLKEQLSIVRKTIGKCRFVYLMGRRPDGSIFILVDSEPPGSKDYSPPGQVYGEVSQSFRRVFETRHETVLRPVVDRWGAWVTALTPLTDPNPVTARVATPDDARAMVRKAIGYLRKNGRRRLLEEINNPRGQFRKGELYAFAYDLGMTVVAHPVKPELVGQNLLDRKDWTGGTYFRKEIRRMALSRGSGWVVYHYENPVSKALDLKTTYFERENGLIVCAGAYRSTGAIVAVLGMDVDVRDWTWGIARAGLPPLLLTLTLTMILLAGVALMTRRSRFTDMPPRWMRHLEPAAVIAVGLALTLFAVWTAHESEFRDRIKSFKTLATSKTEGLATMVRELADVELEGLGLYCATSGNITPQEFQRYARHLTKISYVQAWEWIPAVPAANRARFVLEARASGLTDFEIWQKNGQGERITAAGREVYYPVFLMAPTEGNEPALGYDLGSEPVRRAALEEAARTGLSTATDPIVLMQETGSQKGILICRAVSDYREPKCLRGFVLAALRLGSALKSTAPDQSVSMELSLLRSEGAPVPLAASYDADSPPTSGLSSTRPLFSFGKVFTVTAHAGPEFMRLNPVRSGWMVALIGLLLTAALAFTTTMFVRRRQELERLVAERTGELARTVAALRASEDRYRTVVEDQTEAISRYRPGDGTLTFVNEVFCRFFGKTREDLLGRCWQPVADSEDLQLIAGELRRLSPANPVVTTENRVYDASGAVRWMQFINRGIFDDQGRLVEIQSVGRDITERRQAAEALEQAYQDKRCLLRELQHRAKNSFALIASLINLMEASSDSGETKSALNEIEARVLAVSKMYDLLYATDSVVEVRLDEYLGRVVSSLVGVSGTITLQQSYDAIAVPVKTAIPLGIIITELVTNSIKYAFPDARCGTVRLSLKKSDTGAVIEVGDDGIGLPEGFDPASGNTLGLSLVTILAQQIDGKFTIEGQKGTRCVVEFPL